MAKVGRAAAALRAYQEVTKAGSVGLGARVRAVPRLIRAVMRGSYPGMSRAKLAMMGFGVLYILSPIDAVPEFLLAIGVADDFGVLLWLVTSLLSESGRFVDWERTRERA